MATVSARDFLQGQPAEVIGNETTQEYKRGALETIASGVVKGAGQVFRDAGRSAAHELAGQGGEWMEAQKGLDPMLETEGALEGGSKLATEMVLPPLGLGGSKLVTKAAVGAASKVADTAKVVGESVKGIVDSAPIKGVVRDIVPTAERMLHSEVTRALDLTQGDVKNIALSTGNDVGEFLAKENLIGKTVDETVENLTNFYQKNYNNVRSEIGRVKKQYRIAQIPRYEEALTVIKKQIQDVPGLEKVNAEVDALLAKKGDFIDFDTGKPTAVKLSDVQRVKELIDEHFSLYKATGDVKESVAKEGIAKIRNDLKKFIESEVKKNSGADIKAMNNSVATARSLMDAIETRSTRGLTRANLSVGDAATFLVGMGFGTPLVGALAVLAKKIYQSPAFKLRLAKFFDGLSDARKAKVKAEIEGGTIPPEVKKLIDTAD